MSSSNPGAAITTQTPLVTAIGNVAQEYVLNATLSPAAVPANSTSEQTFTVTGLLVGDFVEVNKPTAQAGLGIVNTRVSAKDTLAITFVNNTAVVQFSAALSPSAVAANTTAEQTFQVAGVLVGDILSVNKPTAQAGLGIVGARVSSAGNVAITFSNNTAGSITPTAAETYLIGAIRTASITPAPNELYQVCLTRPAAQQVANGLPTALPLS